MRFQPRDGAIINMIYQNEGVVAKRQIKAQFWPGKNQRTMEIRLAKLHNAGYIDWPTTDQRRNFPIPEPICWLGWKGALHIASSYDVKIQPPKKSNENQLRRFQKELRDQGIRWVRQPRWSLLRHDIAVTDMKLAILNITESFDNFTLEKWTPESVFRASTDVILVQVAGRDGRKRTQSRGVCPDAHFEIIDEKRRSQGEAARVRFLLEMDMATHDNHSFGREKIIPGAAYISSAAYRTRFGDNGGSWLIVTSGGKTRLKNLVGQAKEKAGPNVAMFFFTTLDQIQTRNSFTDPIWLKANIDQPVQLFPVR